jgi:hypothetical protein
MLREAIESCATCGWSAGADGSTLRTMASIGDALGMRGTSCAEQDCLSTFRHHGALRQFAPSRLIPEESCAYQRKFTMKLLLFAPCERVLFERDGGAASLIIVLHRIQFGAEEPPPPISRTAAVSMKWIVFAQWELEPGDREIDYHQKITLAAADGSVIFSNIARLGLMDFEPQPLHRMNANLDIFPVLPAGIYRLKLALAKSADASESEWIECGNYPLEVQYLGGAKLDI